MVLAKFFKAIIFKLFKEIYSYNLSIFYTYFKEEKSYSFRFDFAVKKTLTPKKGTFNDVDISRNFQELY